MTLAERRTDQVRCAGENFSPDSCQPRTYTRPPSSQPSRYRPRPPSPCLSLCPAPPCGSRRSPSAAPPSAMPRPRPKPLAPQSRRPPRPSPRPPRACRASPRPPVRPSPRLAALPLVSSTRLPASVAAREDWSARSNVSKCRCRCNVGGEPLAAGRAAGCCAPSACVYESYRTNIVRVQP